MKLVVRLMVGATTTAKLAANRRARNTMPGIYCLAEYEVSFWM